MKQTFIIFNMNLDIFQQKKKIWSIFYEFTNNPNVMFIVFCTGIYMEMNNLRVGELRH